MRTQAAVALVLFLGVSILVVAAGPIGAATQSAGAVIVVDNGRVVDESTIGISAMQQIQAAVTSWQQQISGLETEISGLTGQRQQQGAIMTAAALRDLDRRIEQRGIDLQRLRDDAQRQSALLQSQVLGALEAELTPVIHALAAELGASVVLNAQLPGLLYVDPAADVTDQLIARLNAMDQ